MITAATYREASHRVFRKRLTRREVSGLLLLTLGVILVTLQR